MNDSIILEGKLEDIELPTLLMSLYQQSETGVLILSGPNQNKRLYLEEGNIIYADSDNPDDSLGIWFLREGAITLQQFLEVMDSVPLAGSWSRALMDIGVISPDDLMDGLTKQLYENIYSLFLMNSGIYTLNLSPYSTMEMVSLSAEIPLVVYEGMKQLNTWSRMHRIVGGPEEYLTLVKDMPSYGARLEMTSEESHVLDLCRAEIAVSNIMDASYLPPFETYKMLWIFLTLGLVEHKEKRHTPGEKGDTTDLIDVVERYNEITSYVHHELTVLPNIDNLFHNILEELSETYSDLTVGQQEFELHGTLDPEAILLSMRNVPEKDRLPLLNNFLDEILYSAVHVSQTNAPEETHQKIIEGVKKKSRMLAGGNR